MIQNPYPGKFIAFEGIDGCGKTTQIEMAYDFLAGAGVDLSRVKEPAKYLPSGKLIYGLLFGRDKVKFENMSAVQRQRHYFINRIEHYFHTVIPGLEKGINFLTDRSLVSMALDVKLVPDIDYLLEDEESYFRMAEVPFIRPDAVFIYDLPPEVAVQRLTQKDERRRDFFEQPEKIQRTREAYLEFAAKFPDFCRVIDAQGNVDEVFARTQSALGEIFTSVKTL